MSLRILIGSRSTALKMVVGHFGRKQQHPPAHCRARMSRWRRRRSGKPGGRRLQSRLLLGCKPRARKCGLQSGKCLASTASACLTLAASLTALCFG